MHNLRKYIIYNDYLFDKKLSNTSNDPLETRIAVISTSEISSFTYSILRFELQMSAVFTEVWGFIAQVNTIQTGGVNRLLSFLQGQNIPFWPNLMYLFY